MESKLLFSGELKYSGDMPEELFQLVCQVIKTKQPLIYKTNQQFYIVDYSDGGPFVDGSWKTNWLPVRIYRIEKWSTGGIKSGKQEQISKTSDDHS